MRASTGKPGNGRREDPRGASCRERRGTMLRPVEQLKGYRLVDREGTVGSVEDFHIDYHGWRVRHVSIFTGEWLSGRWVLVPSELLGRPDPVKREIPLLILRERIRMAPAPEPDRPPSHLFES